MNISKKFETALYLPLHHDNSFRLCELTWLPNEDKWHGILVEYRLGSADQDAHVPKYIALSYVWGEPTFNVPSEDGMEPSVSLISALGHILLGASKAETLHLWVDQICINQRDQEEKLRQVAMMDRIYSGAHQVIGWLGPAFRESDEALDDIFMLAGASEEGWEDPRSQENWVRIVRSRCQDEISIEGILAYFGSVVILGSNLRRRMLRLFSLSWFQRRWIAQEACLASDLRIYCGLRSVSGEQLFRAIEVIQAIFLPVVSPWLQRPFRNAFALLQTREMVKAARNSGSHLSLPHIAASLGFLDCTEDQDRINALVGIAPSTSDWFHPGYCPATELYTKFARAHIQHFQSLEILHFGGVTDLRRHGWETGREGKKFLIKGPSEDLPSWVPDWRIRYRQLPILREGNETLDNDPGRPMVQVPSNSSDRTLKLRGKLLNVSITPCCPPHLDTHGEKGDPFSQTSTPELDDCGKEECSELEDPKLQFSIDPWSHNIFLNSLHMLNADWARRYLSYPGFSYWLASLYRNGEDPSELLLRFARTLIMDGRVKSRVSPERVVPPESILEYFTLYAHLHFVANGETATAAYKAIVDEHKWMDKIVTYGYLAEEVCRYRQLFVCDNGVLGLGAIGMSPSDRICFFSGLKTPFIVHPKEDHFELRGECYLDGFMDIPFDELDAIERDIVLE